MTYLQILIQECDQPPTIKTLERSGLFDDDPYTYYVIE